MRSVRIPLQQSLRRVPPRRAAALLAVVGLIGGGGIAVAATSSDASHVRLSVPAQEVHQAGGVTSIPALPLIGGAPTVTSASEGAIQTADTQFLSTTLSGLSDHGIPAPAMAAYKLAQNLLSTADAACKIDWALLAGIGRVESDHGRWNGNAVSTNGSSVPGIFGIPLNGANNTAVIRDTDGGRFDRDTTYDRAVGPMQFIPGTWKSVGVDANGDGIADPQNLADAAAASGVYLCSGGGDLTNSADLTRAILRYNNSMDYVREVTAYANAYRSGVDVLPAQAPTSEQLTATPFLPGNEQTATPATTTPAADKTRAGGLITIVPNGSNSSTAPKNEPRPAPSSSSSTDTSSGSTDTAAQPSNSQTPASPVPSVAVPTLPPVKVTVPPIVPSQTAVLFTVGQQVTILAGNLIPAQVVGLTGKIVTINSTDKTADVEVQVSTLLPPIKVTIPFANLEDATP